MKGMVIGSVSVQLLEFHRDSATKNFARYQ